MATAQFSAMVRKQQRAILAILAHALSFAVELWADYAWA
jgi:hypothetical protein